MKQRVQLINPKIHKVTRWIKYFDGKVTYIQVESLCRCLIGTDHCEKKPTAVA